MMFFLANEKLKDFSIKSTVFMNDESTFNVMLD